MWVLICSLTILLAIEIRNRGFFEDIEQLKRDRDKLEKDVVKLREDLNMKKLDECSGPHDFQPDTSKKPVREEICSKCGGKVDKINALWYKRGLEHGKI